MKIKRLNYPVIEPFHFEKRKPEETEHTQHCLEFTIAVLRYDLKFVQHYPNYCKHCNGSGAVETHDSVPYGMGYTDLAGVDICSCIDEGRCPLCGKKHGSRWLGEHCNNCGWSCKGKDLPVFVPEDDCGCWIKQEQSRNLE